MGKGYFYLTSKTGRIKYFVNQGNIFAHLKDRIKWHFYPKLYITPKFPTHIDIEISSKCQLKCPMCGQRNMDKSLIGIMDFKLYKKIVDECAERGVYSIKLSWRGEPLMNPDIWRMVGYAKDRGIKEVAFLTNGVALKERDIKEIVNSGLNFISFSVDGIEEVYEKIRYPAKFDELVKKLKAIKKFKEDNNLKKPLIRIQTIFSAIEKNPEEYFNFFEPIVDRINITIDKRKVGKRDFLRDKDFICPSPWQRMTIAYNGIVAQCHDDYCLKNVLGNVNEKSLYEIWHNEPFEKLRYLQRTKQQDKSPTCAECPHRGVLKEKMIIINGKEVKIGEYIGQKIKI